MFVKQQHLFALAVLALVFTAATASAADKPAKPKHEGPVEFILKHATELELKDEQKTKLEELVKAHEAHKPADGAKPTKADMEAKHKELDEKLKAILTPEQMEKVKALHEKEAADHPKKPKPPTQ